MELSGYLRIARRWWLVLLASVVLAAVGGYEVASRVPKVYEAEVRILVGPLNTDLNTQRAAGQIANTYAQLVSSARITDAVAVAVGLSSGDLKNSISATANDVTRLVDIRVQNASPQVAAAIANKLAEELGVLGGATNRPEGQITLVDPASVPTASVAPQVSLLVLLAAFAGLLAAIVCIVLIEYARDLVTSEDELRELSGSPTLGRVSTRVDRRRDVPSALLSARVGEQYRTLAARVEHSLGNKKGTVLVAGLHDGSAGIVATGIALAFADRGIPAALVDANPLHPDATLALGLRPQANMGAAVASGHVPMFQLTLLANASSPTDSRSVRLLAVPSGADRELGNVADFGRLLEAVRSKAEVVVITTPPLDQSPEAAVWARLADARVMVAALPGTRRRDVTASVETLRLAGLSYVGTILTEAPARVPRSSARRPIARQFTRVVSEVVAAITPPRASPARSRAPRKPPE